MPTFETRTPFLRINFLKILWIFIVGMGYGACGLASTEESFLLRHQNKVWMDQGHKAFALERYKGQSLLVFIGYTSCPTLCPMITGQMKKLEEMLNKKKISTDQLQILFITIEAQDTSMSLLQYAEKHHLDLKRWTLAQAPKVDKDRF